MPRSQRAAAHAAKSKFPNAVKLMKEADPEVKKEGNENKNKKRSASWKGTRPPKQNKGGKKGDSGGNRGCFGRTRSLTEKLRAEHWTVWEHDTAFSGTGRRLHSEPSAAANAKKEKSSLCGSTRALIDVMDHKGLAAKHTSALIDVNHHKELDANLKGDVAHLEPSATADAKKARELAANFDWGATHVDKHDMSALIDEAVDASLKDDVAHLEPIAAADAKKGRELAASFDWGTTDVDKHNMSALIDATIHNELVSKHMSALVDVDLAASLKDGVAHIEPSAAAEAKKARGLVTIHNELVSKHMSARLVDVHSLSKLNSLLLHRVIYDVARDGTKMDGGRTMLGRKEDHLAWNVNKWGKVYENLDGKMCTATYEVDITNGVKVTETFQMLPAHFVKAMLSSMFDQGYHPHFSGVDFPSMKDLFWSMGWHFVFPEDAPQPISLVDVFRGMGYAGTSTWMGW